jgi:hypothetical protein
MNIEESRKIVKERGYNTLNEYSPTRKPVITTRTADKIFDEISGGFIALAGSIEHFYIWSFEGSEIAGVTKIKESAEGDALKEEIKKRKKYVQHRINEIRPIATTEFDTALSAKRTKNINRFSRLVKDIKDDFNESSVLSNGAVIPPESHEVYRAFFSYINLIPELNKIIKKHNTYFSKLKPPRNDQVIEKVWNDFGM